MSCKKVLVVTNTDDAHANEVCKRFNDRSVPVCRLDSDRFVFPENDWRIHADPRRSSSSSWLIPDVSAVWYRKVSFPEARSAAQEFVREETEGLFNSILANYRHCRWVNRREDIAAARSKIAQLQRAKDTGFRIPDTLVTTSVQALRAFSAEHYGRIVAKPMQAQVVGSGDETLVIGTRTLTPEFFESAVACAPCYAQERLPIMSEIRVVAFGEELHAFRLTAKEQADDLKRLRLSQIAHERCELDASIAGKIRALMSSYGLAFSAIDLAIVDEDEPVFLELNPNGQWLWLQYMTGVNLIDPFIDLLCS
jgi:glutathione synthase/RimK-type ligase-like ATP-grasp enzyme